MAKAQFLWLSTRRSSYNEQACRTGARTEVRYMFVKCKVLMQGKLIPVAYTLRTYWNQFSLGGICKQEKCISVRLESEEDIKAWNSENFENSHNSSLWPEYFIDFLCERWIQRQAVSSVLCLHYRPVTVHSSTKNAYTSEITFLAL